MVFFVSVVKFYFSINSRAAFHRLPRLRSLDLGNNEIRIIHPESFLPTRENMVEELWLNNNHIEHSITLRLLLVSLPHLRLLDMSNNFLEDLSYGIVQNHLHLEMLILENNKLLKLGREAFVGLPSLRELKLANNSLAYHLGTPYWNLPALKVSFIWWKVKQITIRLYYIIVNGGFRNFTPLALQKFLAYSVAYSAAIMEGVGRKGSSLIINKVAVLGGWEKEGGIEAGC